MKNQQPFKTKTARILDRIIQAMDIDECRIIERVTATMVEIEMQPAYIEDAYYLIGRSGKTFETMRSLSKFISNREALVLRWDKIEIPTGEIHNRPKASKLPIQSFVEMAQEIGDGLFDEARAVALDSTEELYEIAVEIKASIAPKTFERLIGDLFKVIGKTRGVQVGFSLVANPNMEAKRC